MRTDAYVAACEMWEAATDAVITEAVALLPGDRMNAAKLAARTLRARLDMALALEITTHLLTETETR